jgi:phytoene dehydrogenase-like protein
MAITDAIALSERGRMGTTNLAQILFHLSFLSPFFLSSLRESPSQQRRHRPLNVFNIRTMPQPETDAPEVIIIGAGLAGLTCARVLRRRGVPFVLLDASDGVGGRVRTDMVDGFRLDRGYQVLLTAYPETQRELDYDALDLRPYRPGALVRLGGRFRRVSDLFRRPQDALSTLVAPVGTLADKLRVARLRRDVTSTPLDAIMRREETTTLEALRNRYGFSGRMINRFFRPFLGGIFLDPSLSTSSRMFEFVFKMFAEGEAALPAEGIEAIPRWMARALPDASIRLNTRVEAVEGQAVRLASGEALSAPHVVVATEAPEAATLTGMGNLPTAARSTTCLYYAAYHSPLSGEPTLVLNSEGLGPINNLSFVSDVAPSYAPPHEVLVSITVLDHDRRVSDRDLEEAVRRQCIDWFGLQAGGWTHLGIYHIPYALPEQRPPFLSPPEAPVRRRPGLYVCGDHARTASLNGAIASGRAAAHAVLTDRTAPVEAG